jgi:hypothetical protein
MEEMDKKLVIINYFGHLDTVDTEVGLKKSNALYMVNSRTLNFHMMTMPVIKHISYVFVESYIFIPSISTLNFHGMNISSIKYILITFIKSYIFKPSISLKHFSISKNFSASDFSIDFSLKIFLWVILGILVKGSSVNHCFLLSNPYQMWMRTKRNVQSFRSYGNVLWCAHFQRIIFIRGPFTRWPSLKILFKQTNYSTYLTSHKLHILLVIFQK